MNTPPYNPIYQDGLWAIVDMADIVKRAHRAAGIHPTYPWIMHHCLAGWNGAPFWNFVNNAAPVAGFESEGRYCRECKKTPPDHIITIYELYK